MNELIAKNFSKISHNSFYLPFILLIGISFFLLFQNAFNVIEYIEIQKDYFFYINHLLGNYSYLQFNFTQIGDALISFSLLSVFLVYAPKMWEALISASLVSLIISYLLKKLFSVPRPAAVFDTDSFIIVGKTLAGNNSLPSGHTITIFTSLTILMLAFMPQKTINKVFWCGIILLTAYVFAFSRVGVGAHYPLDVIIGSITGYLCALLGVLIYKKYKIWAWIDNRKFYPIFILLFTVCILFIYGKILKDNLFIYYISIVNLVVSLFIIIRTYVKK